MAEFRWFNRVTSWKSRDDTWTRVNYDHSQGHCSMGDLILHVEKVATDVPYSQIMLSPGILKWETTATVEEHQERVNELARQEAHAREGRLEWYRRLKAEFEPEEGEQVSEQTD